MRLIKILFILLFLGSLVDAQDLSMHRFYHNATSRYNAYFVAREGYLALERARYAEEKRDYIYPLSVYPLIDTTRMASHQSDIDACIQKSSLVLEYHPRNKWTDKAYLLLGHGRMYDGNWKQAKRAYQYVIGRGQSKLDRDAALLALMHVYIQDSLIAEAEQVRRRLRRAPPADEASRFTFLCMQAFLYGRQRIYGAMVPYLEEAIPLASGRLRRARLHFLLAQLYARQETDNQRAYVHYKRAMQRDLPTDLLIQAELNRLAYTKHSRSRVIKRKRRAFKRRLGQRKFQDIQDQVHYHWAVFEDRNHYQKAAITQYRMAARHNQSRSYLGSRSYLRIGELYYGLRDYVRAAAYYDSAMMTLPRWERDYDKKAARAAALRAFVKPYLVIQRQDSLLNLGALPEAELDALLSARARIEREKELADKKRKAQAAKKRARFVEGQAQGPIGGDEDEAPTASLLNQQEGGDGKWYFYNASQRASGYQLFQKKWNGRPLTDHWRRIAAQAALITEQTNEEEDAPELSENKTDLANQGGEESGAKGKDKKGKKGDNLDASVKSVAARVADFKKAIPRTPEAKKAALSQIEEATFEVGKVYYFLLNEPSLSAETYQTFKRRFPQSTYMPQVLYLLMQNEVLSASLRAQYKDTLVRTYPDSLHAKLALNPNYLVERARHTRALQAVYKKAYAHYETGQYEEAQTLIEQALDSIPENTFQDYATLLAIRVAAELEPLHLYVYRLHRFLGTYPKSPLYRHVRYLIASAERIQLLSYYSSRPVYIRSPRDAPYLFGLKYPCSSPSFAEDLGVEGLNFTGVGLQKELSARLKGDARGVDPLAAGIANDNADDGAFEDAVPQVEGAGAAFEGAAPQVESADESPKKATRSPQNSVANQTAAQSNTETYSSAPSLSQDSISALFSMLKSPHKPAFLRLDTKLCICLVPFFEDRKKALEFYEEALAEWSHQKLNELQLIPFIISQDNMETLFLSKGWASYWRYYKQHYLFK